MAENARIQILNGTFDPLSFTEAIEQCISLIRAGERAYLCTVNVAILMMMKDDPELQAFIDRARLIVADGEPIVWLSRALKTPLPERVTGVDLIEGLVKRAAEEAMSVYFLGAAPGVAQQVADRFQSAHPTLRIAGTGDGYFTKEQAPERVAQVRESGASMLFVAMGVPRQEQFMKAHWEALGVPFAMPVGGSFDVLAGLKQRAPRFVQRVGMEWMYRLAQEPQRLWKRYLVTNTQFIADAAPQVLRQWRKP
ncbi:MAG: WecB/TagA/CpsF family glycosyltransferase [Deltaproteobacteria bacterium]|nr:WecB/TagA/CpsF family glycosyltransferase [Deltaproteobacteria bacterium]